MENCKSPELLDGDFEVAYKGSDVCAVVLKPETDFSVLGDGLSAKL